MLIAARTASRPASTASHRPPGLPDGALVARDDPPAWAREDVPAWALEDELPGVPEDVISSAARSTARSVAWRIDSVAWPVSGASECASDARSGRAGIPAAVIAAAAG
jgi:hypothetical protein